MVREGQGGEGNQIKRAAPTQSVHSSAQGWMCAFTVSAVPTQSVHSSAQDRMCAAQAGVYWSSQLSLLSAASTQSVHSSAQCLIIIYNKQ